MPGGIFSRAGSARRRLMLLLSAAVLAANPLCMPEALEVFRRNGLVK